eukprot:7323105-Pyramimonas_sp.AAC.3
MGSPTSFDRTAVSRFWGQGFGGHLCPQQAARIRVLGGRCEADRHFGIICVQTASSPNPGHTKSRSN